MATHRSPVAERTADVLLLHAAGPACGHRLLRSRQRHQRHVRPGRQPSQLHRRQRPDNRLHIQRRRPADRDHRTGRGTPDTTYDYTADGMRSSMTDATGTTSYSYDDLDRLSSETDGSGATVSYGYNADNAPTSIEYPNSETVDQTFNTDGAELRDRLARERDAVQLRLRLATQPDHLPQRHRRHRHVQLRPSRRAHGITMAQDTTTLASITYERTAAGQTSSETDTGLPGTASTSYSYDDDGRLGEVGSDDTATTRTDPTELGGTSGYEYDLSELHKLAKHHLRLRRGWVSHEPDTGSTTTTYSYNPTGTLASVTHGSEQTSYTYNGDGQLATSTTSGTTTDLTWNDNGTLPTLLSDGSNSYIYGPDDLPIEEIAADSTSQLPPPRPARLHAPDHRCERRQHRDLHLQAERHARREHRQRNHPHRVRRRLHRPHHRTPIRPSTLV